LNFILRFLRHAKYGELSDSWILADGAELSEGNGNKAASSDEAAGPRSFVWKGGQERQTTGIWMWSTPFIKECAQTGQKIAILLMDTQGMFDNGD
jgi:atlastin